MRRKLPDETEERVRGRGVTFNSLLGATNREHAVRVEFGSCFTGSPFLTGTKRQ